MKTSLLVGCLSVAAHAFDWDAAPPHPEYIFENPPASIASGFRIPTSYESAVMGRRILALSKLGHLSTVFPSRSSSSSEEEENADSISTKDWRRPSFVGGSPIGMMDYVADCETEDVGNPTILAITIATSFQNVRAGSNISLSMRWTPPYPPEKRMGSSSTAFTVQSSSLFDSVRRFLGLEPENSTPRDDEEDDTPDTVPYSAANLPRFSLIGYLESIHPDDETEKGLAECFVRKHQDAKYWLPGNRIHRSEWARLVVTAVYWVGGFGDRAYIGWLPLDQWRNVTREEWESVRLPGEKEGWKEWSADAAWEGADL